MKLLCISNGHGEDVIACRILNALRQSHPSIELSALPITGDGKAYQSTEISIIGQTQVLPSGGFLNRDPKQLARDVQQGLIPLTRSQLADIKTWANDNDNAAILAVGDIVPQIFSHLSGLPYVFIGTAKSEYWLRDEQGKLPAKKLWDRFEGWSGSVYLPWERWLMARPNCRAVFARDALTAKTLQDLGIRAHYAGNPMMDGLAPEGKLDGLLQHVKEAHSITAQADKEPNPTQDNGKPLPLEGKDQDTLTIALIPGSRQPEAYDNWANIMAALPSLVETFPEKHIILLGAIAPSLSPEKLPATANTWTHQSKPYSTFTHKNVTLLLISDAYNDCLHQADIAIATAGTATEQFVGLGKPAITLPGNGPQFTQAFATVQAKMLGPSIQMVSSPDEIGSAIAQILNDRDRLQRIQENGKQRMGEPGGGSAIANLVIQHLTQKVIS